jgi:hypothetical protein
MTLFLACIFLYQFEWPWYWYPLAVLIWLLHELQFFAKFRQGSFARRQPPPIESNPNAE